MNLRPAIAIAPTLAALLSAAEPIPVAPTEAPVAEAPAPAPYTVDEVEALVARARSERLAAESHWLVLLHYAHGNLPFGGVKQTGNGHREGGWEVYEFYSETKVCYVDYSGALQRAQIDTYSG